MLNFCACTIRNDASLSEEDNWGISPIHKPQNLMCGFAAGNTNAMRFFNAWRQAALLKKKNPKGLVIVTIPEGTLDEYAPEQKPPKKKYA